MSHSFNLSSKSSFFNSSTLLHQALTHNTCPFILASNAIHFSLLNCLSSYPILPSVQTPNGKIINSMTICFLFRTPLACWKGCCKIWFPKLSLSNLTTFSFSRVTVHFLTRKASQYVHIWMQKKYVPKALLR